MSLAEAVYTRSSSLRREPQPYQPRQSRSPAPKEPMKTHSPDRLAAMESDLSNQSHLHALRFGRFRLVLHSRELLADGVPLAIGNRALDVLFALIEAQGELVTKDELLSQVWPNTTVEENNLQFQVSTLRKALGNDRDSIRTVSGRGYRFIAEITAEYRPPRQASENAALGGRDAAADQVRAVSHPGNLAAPMTDIAGREAQRKDFGAAAGPNSLVTLAGAESIGKMRLAFELARRAVPSFANGTGIADCGRVLDTSLGSTAVASASGLEDASNLLERPSASLNSKHLLLLLESCEHIIETVTAVAEALLQANAKL